MPLTAIPTKTEDSLGIVKQDVLPYTNPNTQVPAVQFERLKDAVIANALAVGLGDGSTQGSVVQRLNGIDARGLQYAYTQGNEIDTTSGPAVLVKSSAGQLAIRGDALAGTGAVALSADSVELAAKVAGVVRLVIDSKVRMALRLDVPTLTSYLEPGTDLETSLGSASKRYAEVFAAALRATELASPTPNVALKLQGNHTTDATAAAVRATNGPAFSAAAGEQRLLEVSGVGAQSGTASLVVADLVLAGTVGSGPSTAILRARAGSTILNVTSTQVQAAPGSAASPGVAFVSEPATGLFRSSAGVIGMATSGVSRLTVDGTSLASAVVVRGPAGTVAAPAHSFTTDAASGMYSPAANQVGVSAGGADVGVFVGLANNLSHLRMSNGNIAAATAPVANALYAKNVPKSWLRANGTTLSDGFGVTSVAASGSPAAALVTFANAASAAGAQAVVATAAGTTATAAKWLTVDNITTTQCTVRAWVWSGTAIVQTAMTGDWSLVRFATV